MGFGHHMSELREGHTVHVSYIFAPCQVPGQRLYQKTHSDDTHDTRTESWAVFHLDGPLSLFLYALRENRNHRRVRNVSDPPRR